MVESPSLYENEFYLIGKTVSQPLELNKLYIKVTKFNNTIISKSIGKYLGPDPITKDLKVILFEDSQKIIESINLLNFELYEAIKI